ncbi:MAG: extracellular solute-binding protein, partial [Sphaerochaetaceae bacterium]|nr:extracellular solute-binding protein [Sphaerochaetaceae bacterium]
MKRLVLLLVILTLVSLSVFTAAQKESAVAEDVENKPVTIEFACWGIAEDSTRPAFEAMIDAFEAKYPWITVEITGYAYNSVKDQLLIRSAGGTPPDVAQIAPIWVASLAEMGALKPVDEILSDVTMNDYFDSALGGTFIQGSQMSAPWTINPILVFYNKELLKQAGYTEEPKSWEEMHTMASDIAALGADASGNRLYGRSIASKLLPGAGYFFFVDIWQNGGEFTDKDGKVMFDQPGTVKAFA